MANSVTSGVGFWLLAGDLSYQLPAPSRQLEASGVSYQVSELAFGIWVTSWPRLLDFGWQLAAGSSQLRPNVHIRTAKLSPGRCLLKVTDGMKCKVVYRQQLQVNVGMVSYLLMLLMPL